MSSIFKLLYQGPAEARLSEQVFSDVLRTNWWPSAVINSSVVLLSLWHIPHIHSLLYMSNISFDIHFYDLWISKPDYERKSLLLILKQPICSSWIIFDIILMKVYLKCHYPSIIFRRSMVVRILELLTFHSDTFYT